MPTKTLTSSYDHHNSDESLSPADRELLQKAREITRQAYAPYSQFHVGAAALLQNGEVVLGTNQENASYPVGICAERVLLSVAATLHPGVAVETMAISYSNNAHPDSTQYPIAPCGMCRQYMAEYEDRVAQPMRLLLSGQTGAVHVLPSAGQLLPFRFRKEDLE